MTEAPQLGASHSKEAHEGVSLVDDREIRNSFVNGRRRQKAGGGHVECDGG